MLFNKYYIVMRLVCCVVLLSSRQCIPPPVLVAPTPPPFSFSRCLLTVPSELGKAIAPLHRRMVAEPELLLRGIGCVRAHAADIDRVLRAALDAAPSLSMMSPVAVLEPKGPPDGRR